ncbi:hypothetical protein B0H11DRAFT_1999097 [Mycena galericulata]|nr:hypothetical protein B0H11DRAFT_1999097 [Mycena galericulata]
MAHSTPLLSPPIYLCLLLAAVSAGAQCENDSEGCPTVTFPNDSPPNPGPPVGTIIGVIFGIFGFLVIVALITQCARTRGNQNIQQTTYVQNAQPAPQANPADLNLPPYSLELPVTTHHHIHHMHHHGHNDMVNQINLQNQFAMQNQMSTTMAANTMATNPGM